VTAADSQSDVIAFLSDPARYGLGDGGVGDGGVEQIETHCSIVFLTGDRAYKLKRAIRYSSLDYTTLESRRAACEAELLLNRRTAPKLYLGVRSINRDAAGRLAFDGPGPAVDFVVVMRRFPRSDLFDRMEETGRLTPDLMHALGEALARFHQAAEPTPDFGGSEAIRRVIENNDRELGRVAPALNGAAVGDLSSHARTALDRVADLLDQRRAAGKVRQCHGDLRLANICLWAGRPTPFDCIEFSEEIGCIDVLYDMAFLLMDLHVRGRGDLGNAVFNAWLDVMPETDGLRALPLFLALRAATRGYALAGGAARQTDPRQAARRLTLARHHIQAGVDFLVPRQPLLVAMGGDAGTGRSDLAARLAAVIRPVPGARILRLGPSIDGVCRDAGAVLEAGCSVVIEGAFAEATQRQAVADLATRLGIRSFGFFLGALPAGQDEVPQESMPWKALDPGQGMPAVLADAAALLMAEVP
jgi:aminoglycoside phosphotransferase family enzyme